MYIEHNENPQGRRVGDCTVRAISCATGQSWEETYIGLALQGYLMADMPSSNRVWGAYLRAKGFTRTPIPNTCPDCYSVEDFCQEHPRGTYILALDGHVVCIHNASYLDTWDSGGGMPLYYWEKEDE